MWAAASKVNSKQYLPTGSSMISSLSKMWSACRSAAVMAISHSQSIWKEDIGKGSIDKVTPSRGKGEQLEDRKRLVVSLRCLGIGAGGRKSRRRLQGIVVERS